jgi:hypothetical protein
MRFCAAAALFIGKVSGFHLTLAPFCDSLSIKLIVSLSQKLQLVKSGRSEEWKILSVFLITPYPEKDLEKARRTKAKYIRKFGDDSGREYHLAMTETPVVGKLWNMQSLSLSDASTARNSPTSRWSSATSAWASAITAYPWRWPRRRIRWATSRCGWI